MLSEKFICATLEMCGLFDKVPSPYLRKSFELKEVPAKASITVCGLGFYELFMNGKRITRGLLSPYMSNANHVVYYDTYDLTPYLVVGENVIGIQLGNGMQNNFGGFIWDFEKVSWRSAPKVALYFEATYGTGEKLQFEADETFRCTQSPLRSDDLRLGEHYDAREEIPGWNLPGFNDETWYPALKAETPKGIRKHAICEPICEEKQLKPVQIWEEDESFIYDFGENNAGICKMKVQGKEGQQITLTFGECLREGKFQTDNITFLRPGLPVPFIQQDEYICRGQGVEYYEPYFTYHGFQYVKMSGIQKEQATEDLLTYSVMSTKLEERGDFKCSDEVINKLQQMTRRATLANFYHFPTDCPHREKNGWTADAALSLEHTLLNLQADANYRQWQENICLSMDEKGGIPGIVPTDTWGYGIGPAWDSVLIWIPYYIYIMRGDLQVARESAEPIMRYIDYLVANRNKEGLFDFGLGDWCAPHGTPKSPVIVTSSIVSMDLCIKAALLFEAMEMQSEYEVCTKRAGEFREAIRTHLIDWDTMTVAGDCQTSQAMGIYYNVFDENEKQKAFAILMKQINEMENHIDCGVLGARVIFHVLSEYGESDLAYHMIQRPDEPSYGKWVAQGETTLLEAFTEKYDESSHNHHFFGDISAWFIKWIGGIQINPHLNNIHEVMICPQFIESLEFAEAYHRLDCGKIQVKWTRENEKIRLEIEIPDEVKGEIKLLGKWRFEDGVSSKDLVQGTFFLKYI